MYKATVVIKLKKGVLNPEGRTVLRALNFLGYDEVKDITEIFLVSVNYVYNPAKGERREFQKAFCHIPTPSGLTQKQQIIIRLQMIYPNFGHLKRLKL